MGLFGRFKKVKLEDTSDIVKGLMQDFKATVSPDDFPTMGARSGTDTNKPSEWWSSTFTKEEQEYIASKLGSRSIADEFSVHSKRTADMVLGVASTHFNKDTDRRLAHLMLAEAERQAENSGDILGLHFTYSQMVKTYYRDRDNDPESLDAAISACEKQIKLGPQAALAWRKDYPGEDLPGHEGFNQLRIIRDKQKDYDAAIEVCKEAIAQGWGLAAHWEADILKLETKRSKTLKP